MTEGRSAQWTVDEQRIKKDIKGLRGSRDVLKQLRYFVDEVEKLTDGEDPSSLGDQKLDRRFERCYVKKLTKSYRLVYKVCRERREVHLIKIGDHKSVYGRD